MFVPEGSGIGIVASRKLLAEMSRNRKMNLPGKKKKKKKKKSSYCI